MIQQGPLSGQTVGGKYLLGDLLGKGGFGAVYQATNQLLQRPQAVKVLLEEHLGDPTFRARFLREARLLATLDHANIVHIDDIGIEDRIIYLVMPYINGGTLQDRLKARAAPLGLDEVLRYLEPTCLALGYAHAHGVAHLDLKPSNLLLRPDGRLLLADFGLAHLMELGTLVGGSSLQFGSPLYMAPEHIEGKPTRQSDLYALGVMLYEMLTGRPPFEASTPLAVLRKHLTEPPPLLREARPDVPEALEAVVAKALAKPQEQRYARAGEMLVDFRAALEGQALRFAGALEPARQVPTPLDSPSYRPTSPGSPLALARAGTLPPFPPPTSQPGAIQTATPQSSLPDVPHQTAVPPVSGKGRVWTPGFTGLFVLLALSGGIVVVVMTVLLSLQDDYTVAMIALATLVLGLGGATCLGGLRLVRPGLIRTGLCFQLGAQVLMLVLAALLLYLDQAPYQPGFDTLYSVADVYLPFLATLLSAAGLVVLSYGMVRGPRGRQTGFTVLQVVVSGLVSTLLLTHVDFSSWFDLGGDPLLLWMLLTAGVFAGTVFWLRPGCWKRYPAVTVLLALGAVLLLIQTPAVYLVLATWAGADAFPAWYRVVTLSWLCLLLGFLVLIQTERVRQQMQQSEEASPAYELPSVWS